MPIEQLRLQPMAEHDYRCDKCRMGHYRPSGEALLTFPPQYPHDCNRCGDTKTFGLMYPYIGPASIGGGAELGASCYEKPSKLAIIKGDTDDDEAGLVMSKDPDRDVLLKQERIELWMMALLCAALLVGACYSWSLAASADAVRLDTVHACAERESLLSGRHFAAAR